MQAQRARRRKAIDSYESESSLVPLLICADELPLDKASVSVKAIAGFRTGLGVNARSAEHKIGLAYNTAEIRDCRRIPSFRMGAQRICQRERRAIDRSGEITVDRDT